MNRIDEAQREFDKARSMAYWSFVGILMPLLGIILGLVSYSKLKSLRPHTDKEKRDISSTMNVATWGVVLSILMIIAGSAFGVWLGNEIKKENERAIQQAQKAEEEKQRADALPTYNEIALGQCLDNVNDWYNTNIRNVTTIYQEQSLLQSKQQQMDECQLRYPAD